MDNRFRVVQMTISQAMDAIMKPAQDLISKPVSEEIIKLLPGVLQSDFDLLKENGKENQKPKVEPFLLSLICERLNEKRIEKGLKTEKKLTSITSQLVSEFNVSEVINSFYNETIGNYEENVAEAIEDMLLTEGGLRKLQVLSEMQLNRHISNQEIEELVNARIIRRVDRESVTYVELIHDVLAPVIKKKRDKRIEENKERQRRDDLRQARLNHLKGVKNVGILVFVVVIGLIYLANRNELFVFESQLNDKTNILKARIEVGDILESALKKQRSHPTESYRYVSPYKSKKKVQEWLDSKEIKSVDSVSNFKLVTTLRESLEADFSFRPFYLKKIDLPSYINKRHIKSTKTRTLNDSANELLLFVQTQNFLLSTKVKISNTNNTQKWDTIHNQIGSYKPYYADSTKTKVRVLYSDKDGLYDTDSEFQSLVTKNCDSSFQKLRNIEHMGGTNFVALSNDNKNIVRFDISKDSIVADTLKSTTTFVKFIKKISATEIVYIAEFKRKPHLVKMNIADQSKTVKLDLSTLKINNVYDVKAFNIDKERKRLIIASNNKVFVFNYSDNELVKIVTIETHHRQMINSIESYKNQIMIGSRDKTVSIYRDEEYENNYIFSKELIDHSATVLNVSFYDKGNIGITSGEDGKINFWNLKPIEKGSLDFKEHYGGRPIKLKFNPTDHRLYVGVSFKDSGLKNYVMSFNSEFEMDSKETLTTIIKPKSRYNYLSNFDFINSSKSVGVYYENQFQVASKNPSEIRTISEITEGKVIDLKIRDERMVVAQDKKLLFYKNANDKIASLQREFPEANFNSIDIHPTMNLALASSDNGKLYLWYIADNTFTELNEHEDQVMDACFSRDGEFIVSGSWDTTVIVWRKQEGSTQYKPIQIIEGHTDDVNDVEISDSGLVASAGMGEDKRVLLHQIKIGEDSNVTIEPMTSLIRHDWGIRSIAFNEKDTLLYSADGNGIVKMWKYMEFDTIIEERTANWNLKILE